jgi:Uncharacterized protein conserved in bacteria (DUF2213)
MANAYYGTKLSKNLAETPEGYLVCRDAVIARTGMQKYRGIELPQRTDETPAEEVTAQDLGIAPDDMVDLYRSPDEVFSPRTIASFEGKAITDGHPYNLVSVGTHNQLACGHVRNVRRGKEPLEDGNWPLLADLVVTDPALIEKIKAGLRELSCGYTYSLLKKGNNIRMVDILGNHVAVVREGRAGFSASIKDRAVGLDGDVFARQFLAAVKSALRTRPSRPKPTGRPLPAMKDGAADLVSRCNSMYRETYKNHQRVIYSNELGSTGSAASGRPTVGLDARGQAINALYKAAHSDQRVRYSNEN